MQADSIDILVDIITYIIEYILLLSFSVWAVYFNNYFWNKSEKRKISFKKTLKESYLICLVLVVIDIILDQVF
jgi:hypothetical protein